MSPDQVREVTELLQAWSGGDQTAFNRLFPLVYEELRRLARSHLRRERPGHALQTTRGVLEVYLRLTKAREVDWRNRVQFFALSGQVMRHVLVDAARERQAAKRGGHAAHVSIDDADGVSVERGADLVALDDALHALGKIDPRKVRVVELRYFAGLDVEETAEALSVSVETVMRDWKMAKLWLLRELRRDLSLAASGHETGTLAANRGDSSFGGGSEIPLSARCFWIRPAAVTRSSGRKSSRCSIRQSSGSRHFWKRLRLT